MYSMGYTLFGCCVSFRVFRERGASAQLALRGLLAAEIGDLFGGNDVVIVGDDDDENDDDD